MVNRRHSNQRRRHRGSPEQLYYYDFDEPEEETPVVPWRAVATFAGALSVLLLVMRSDMPAFPARSNMRDPHADDLSMLGSLFAGVTGKTEPPFIPSKFKYGFPVFPNEHTLPPPNATNQTTVVLVLSARKHFERRAVIRDTWAKTNDNVYFVVGGPDPEDKADTNKSKRTSTLSRLLKEQELYGDLIDSIHPDSYKALPFKLHYGMKWVIDNVPHVNWIAKADDDHVVRVKLLQFFVLRKFNPHHPSVIGGIVVGAPPHRTGKWAEDPKFKADV
jgi:Galactosyltransferase